MAIDYKVKNLKNGGVMRVAFDPDAPIIEPPKRVKDIAFLIDFSEAMEDIKAANDKRLNAIGAVFQYLIDKYSYVELTPEIEALLDEVAASPLVASFDTAKKEKIKGA